MYTNTTAGSNLGMKDVLIGHRVALKGDRKPRRKPQGGPVERGGVQDVHGGRYLCSPNSYGQTVTPLSKTSCFAPQSSSPFLLGDRPLLWGGRWEDHGEGRGVEVGKGRVLHVQRLLS